MLRPVPLRVQVTLFSAFSLGLFGCAQDDAETGEFEVPDDAIVVVVGESSDPGIGADVRSAAEMQTLDQFKVFHDFSFVDRQPVSGLDFHPGLTEDSGKAYKPNHYDHGNGIAVADVDGDDLFDVYLVSPVGPNGLFKNNGDGTFTDITERGGVALEDQIGVTSSFADIDNDGDPDLFVTTVRYGNTLFLNDGTGRFTDVTAEAGLEFTGHSSGVVFFDYNLDGALDLFLSNVGRYTTDEVGPDGHYIGFGFLPNGLPDAFAGHLFPERIERSILYRNRGDGTFEDVSEATGLIETGWNGDANPGDFNGDGYPDLYIYDMQGDDDYWENVGGERFVKRSAEVFPNTPWGAMSGKFFDANLDGRLDLLLTDMHSDMSQEVPASEERVKSPMIWPEEFLEGGDDNLFGNAFFQQDANGRFVEMSDELGVETYWPWGVSVGDLNADGYDDAFLTSSMNFPWRYHPNALLLNNRGTGFLHSEYILGVEPRRDGVEYARKMVLQCAGVDSLFPRCQGQDAVFDVRGALGSRSSAIFDIDGDGDLDIVTNEFGSEPLVLVSDLSEKQAVHFLQVRLVGQQSNRDGLGARVTVTAGGQSYVKVHDGVSGYLSHSLLPLYFGLGAATEVTSVEIRWPSGQTQMVTDGITVGSTLTVTEPGG
jgi:enediyne biosynthesis protein E4